MSASPPRRKRDRDDGADAASLAKKYAALGKQGALAARKPQRRLEVDTSQT
jgi:hypothetical protein